MGITKSLRSINMRDHNMSNMHLIYMDHIRVEFKWACFQKTCPQLILVWHLATGICEVELSISRQQKKENSWYLSPLSWIRNLCSHKPFLTDLESLEGNLRTNYIVVNSISRYCAYLLISAPELLPHNKIFAERIFEDTIVKTREVLKSCDSSESIYMHLMERGKDLEEEQDQTTVQPVAGQMMSTGIVEMGAKLGYALVTKTECEERWKMLSHYWSICCCIWHLLQRPNPMKNTLQRGGSS